MALEELIIKIKALYDNDGFSKAETGLARFNNELSQTDGFLGKVRLGIETFGKYIAMAFMAATAALVGFFTIAIGKAMEAEKGWAIFAGAIGEASSEIAGVKAEFSGLFTEIARGTAQSAGAIRDTATQLALLGLETSALGVAVNDVAVIANLRFGGDMTSAQETYYKALQGNGRSLKNLGTTLEKLGYTSEQWQSMTLEQRAAILDTYLKEAGWMQANENYLNTAAGKWQTIQNEANKALTTFGNIALELLNSSGILDMIIGLLRAFNENPAFAKTATAVALIVTALLGIGTGLWVLTKMADMFGTVKGAVAGVLEKLGILNATPCSPKECVTKSTTQCGGTTGTTPTGGGTSAAGIVAGVLGSALASVAGGAGIQMLGKAGGLGQGAIDYASGIMGLIPGVGAGAMFGQFLAGRPVSGKDMAMSAIPGSGMMGGLSNMLGLKFPSINKEDILKLITPKIEWLKWLVPGASSLVQMISDFIAWLGWTDATTGQLVQMIKDFIAWLGWTIPTATDLVNMISGFISYLTWRIPSATDILNAVVARMVGGSAGDERSLAEAAALKPITTTFIGAGGSGGGSKQVINNTPVINIDRIDSRDTAEYFAQRVANELSMINDRKGR